MKTCRTVLLLAACLVAGSTASAQTASKNAVQVQPTVDPAGQSAPVGKGEVGPRGSGPAVVDCAFAQDVTNCQTFQYPRVAGTSIASMGSPNTTLFRVADAFRTDGASTHSLTEVCWWGAYTSRVAPAFDCTIQPPSTVDHFFVTIYAMTAGLPDITNVVGAREQGVDMTVTRRDFCDPGLRSTSEYHATFSTAIELQPFTCYALEVRNPNDNTVNWFWSHTDLITDNISWQDTTENGYTTVEAGVGNAGDRAWCLNVGVDIFQAICGTPPPPICVNPDTNGQVRGAINGGGFSNSGPGAVGLQLGDSVQFASAGTISNVCFWGFWVAPDGTQPTGPETPDFDFTIYDSNGTDGLPGTTLLTGRAGVTAGFTSRRIAQNYNIAFPTFTVTANHCYYISIAYPQDNNDPAHAFRFVYGLAAPNTITNEQMISRPGTGGDWAYFSFGTDPAFPSNGSWVFDLAAELPGCGLPPPPPPPAANDLCADATDIAGEGTFNFDTRGALTDGTSNCDPTSGRDVWFDWTAPCAGDYTLSACGLAAGDTVINAYSSTACPPDQANEINCDDDGCGTVGGPSTFVMTGIANGAHVLIRVSHFGGSTGEQGAFSIARVGGGCGPTAPCCDFNNDNSVNSQDFFDFLVAFFGSLPTSDFNGDNTLNSQDFFDFIVCFFNPPAGCP